MSRPVSFTPTPTYDAIPLNSAQPHSRTRTSIFGSLQKWLKFRSLGSVRWWMLYGTATAGMFIARIPYIFPNGFKLHLGRERYFHYSVPINKYPLLVHLVTILPASLLAVSQFVPRIRSRFTSYHRITGRVINALTVVSTLSGWSIARVSFGGDLSIQSGIYVLGLMTLYSMIASWRAIRQLRIDEHREWIIRAWGYQMSIVTMRLITFVTIVIIGRTGGHYTTMPCAEVANSLNDPVLFAQQYPQCLPDWPGKPVTHLSIEAGFGSRLALAAAMRVTFGMSMWVGICIHAIGVEYYLSRTKDGSARLREVSLKRQKLRRGSSTASEGNESN